MKLRQARKVLKLCRARRQSTWDAAKRRWMKQARGLDPLARWTVVGRFWACDIKRQILQVGTSAEASRAQVEVFNAEIERQQKQLRGLASEISS